MNTQNIVGKIVYAKRVDDYSTPAAYICVYHNNNVAKLVSADLSINAAFVKPVYLSVEGTAGWKIVGVIHDPEWIGELVDYLEELFYGETEWETETRAIAETTIGLLRDLIESEHDGAHAATYEPDPETEKAAKARFSTKGCDTGRSPVAEPDATTPLAAAHKEYADRLLAFREAAAKYRAALDDEYRSDESLLIRKLWGWA